VVGDAEEPSLGVGDWLDGGGRLHCLEQRFLQHVLAVDDRAGHPGAVAVEARPKLAHHLLDRLLRPSGQRLARSVRHRRFP